MRDTLSMTFCVNAPRLVLDADDRGGLDALNSSDEIPRRRVLVSIGHLESTRSLRVVSSRPLTSNM